MAAKLLHSLADDNPDLQKQIGCMTGVFQLFDRHQIVSGRRITSHSPKRLPPGNSQHQSFIAYLYKLLLFCLFSHQMIEIKKSV